MKKSYFNFSPKNTDEGAILAEVLVSVLILIVVCVFSLQVLASISSARLGIEQRDRAVEISNGIVEKIKAMKCNQVVDDIPTIAVKARVCDFNYKTTGIHQLGDQNFEKIEANIHYTVKIRYWWSKTGVILAANDTCRKYADNIIASANTEVKQPDVSHVLVEVSWKYGSTVNSVYRKAEISIVEDSSELSITGRGGIIKSLDSTRNMTALQIKGLYSIARIYDLSKYGQPKCAWFPYLKSGQISLLNTNVFTLSANTVVVK